MSQLNRQTLINAFPNWMNNGGIFVLMPNAPWINEVDNDILDIEYFGNRSGVKFIAPLVYKFLDENGEVTDNGRSALARLILAKYRRPWEQLWRTYQLEYNPLDSYSITDSHYDNRTETGGETRTDAYGHTIADTGTSGNTNTKKQKEKTTEQGRNSNENRVHGFNSTAQGGVQSTESSGTYGQNTSDYELYDHEDKDSYTRNLVSTHGGTDTTNRTQNLHDDNEGGYTRRGRLGYITNQRALSEDRAFWVWDFFEQVFKDCDEVLSIPVMDMCSLQSIEWTGQGSGSSYVLPIANASTIGGVKPLNVVPGATQPVYVDVSGRLWITPPLEYDLPVAAFNRLGGVKPLEKIASATQSVYVDSDGRLYTVPPSVPEPYSLPMASSDTLGGVKADEVQSTDTTPVRIDSNGNLWVAQGSSESVLESLATFSRYGGLVSLNSTNAPDVYLNADNINKGIYDKIILNWEDKDAFSDKTSQLVFYKCDRNNNFLSPTYYYSLMPSSDTEIRVAWISSLSGNVTFVSKKIELSSV